MPLGSHSLVPHLVAPGKGPGLNPGPHPNPPWTAARTRRRPTRLDRLILAPDTLEEFNYDAQPAVDQALIQELAT